MIFCQVCLQSWHTMSIYTVTASTVHDESNANLRDTFSHMWHFLSGIFLVKHIHHVLSGICALLSSVCDMSCQACAAYMAFGSELATGLAYCCRCPVQLMLNIHSPILLPPSCSPKTSLWVPGKHTTAYEYSLTKCWLVCLR